ncbi:MAG: hypothetical protein IJV85_02530 [Clostridia bacterium]|nr:hypothetical protein [Clostridia bacterium]
MDKEENVDKKNGSAEDGAEAQENAMVNRTEIGKIEASAVLGKFKDVDALAKAYGSLQAEFTRRSQRLKELEKEAEILKSGAETLHSGAEKLRKNAAARRAEKKEFDEFLSDVERGAERETTEEEEAWKNDAVSPKTEVAQSEEVDEGDALRKAQSQDDLFVEREAKTAIENGEKSDGKTRANLNGANGGLEENVHTLERAGGSVTDTGRKEISPSELFELVRQNEDVRLKIVGEYLASVGKTEAPLMRGGAGTLVTPPARAKSIGDAGSMALRFFKNKAQEGF